MTAMDWARADMDPDDPGSQGYSPDAPAPAPRQHVLTTKGKLCGQSSVCFRGYCSCGQWETGPHFRTDTVEAYWNDHVHLVCEPECALHGSAA